MNIAILGATSQIAKDLIYSLIVVDKAEHSLNLFARSPEKIIYQLNSLGITSGYFAYHFNEFNNEQKFDLIVNFVGVGNPAQAAAMGSSIFDITLEFDSLALDYLYGHPDCRYIFLSSGAAYGVNFEKPVDEESLAVIPLNNFQSEDYYSLAKIYAEGRHRALQNFSIVDIRLFNYFSHTQDMESRYLITDIVRAIKHNTILKTSSENIVRDYLHPSDFYRLIKSIIESPPINTAVDCYTRLPVDKFELLSFFESRFNLSYELQKNYSSINATGAKFAYYSLNKSAALFGYAPTHSSLSGLELEVGLFVENN